MAGIANYYHGEGGEVVRLGWAADPELLFFVLELEGDPHRRTAQVYGSDISIDPDLRPGDRAVYIRLGTTTGIWLRQGEEQGPALEHALQRAGENQRWMEEFSRAGGRRKAWLAGLARQTGRPVRELGEDEVLSEAPRLDLSLFLSYSSSDVLLARDLYERLREEARVDVWFDLAQGGETLRHEEEVRAWLRGGVHSCKGLVLLLTRSSAASQWVQAEIGMARERMAEDPGFRLVVLQMEDAPVPAGLSFVDGRGLSPGEILEELYAKIYGREGRQDWLRRQGKAPRAAQRDAPPLLTRAGEAVSFSWRRRGWDLEWCLVVRHGDEIERVEGRGDSAMADLGIRPGDQVAFFVSDKVPLWMRSKDLALTPAAVVRHYRKVLQKPPPAVRAANLALLAAGLAVVWLVGRFAHQEIFGSLFTGVPPGIDPAQVARATPWVRGMLAGAIGLYGLCQVARVAHPLQFRGRSARGILEYLGNGLTIVAWGCVVHPGVHLLAVFILFVPVVMVFGLVTAIFGDPGPTAVFWLFVAVFGISFVYPLMRLVEIVREGPEYLRRVELDWVP